MALELKLTSTRIRWSLAVKAAAFGAGWLFLPFWAFLLLAAYFYLRPLFQPAKLLVPFLLLLYFTAVEPRSFWFAALFAVLFYFIIGIKNFHIIDRRSIQEILALLLIFLLLEKFYAGVSGWDSAFAVFGALGIGTAVFFLSKTALAGNSVAAGRLLSGRAATNKENVSILVLALLSSELILTALFLPLSFLYQSAVALVIFTVLFEIVGDFLSDRLERKRVLFALATGFIFLAIILGSAQWTL